RLARSAIATTMDILAHRGNSRGPLASAENQLPALARCLGRGWGLEIDIRRDATGAFYCSHDPGGRTSGNDAETILRLIASCPGATVAVNIKELGYEQALVGLVQRFGLWSRAFLFDMELIESVRGETAARLRRDDAGVALAARASDRGEP